jgi:PilZ domain
MAEDRRAAPRQEAYLSAALETAQGKSAIAITRDISSTGLLILVGTRVVVGETIKLTVVLDDSQRSLSARVVREERIAPHELWRYKVALAVDGDDPVLAQIQATLAAQAQAQAQNPAVTEP